MRFAGRDIEEGTRVRVTGTSGSGARQSGLAGTVGAACPARGGEPAAIKVWPDPDSALTDDELFVGKILFSEPQVESLEVLPDD
jgi:hypothetical protein